MESVLRILEVLSEGRRLTKALYNGEDYIQIKSGYIYRRNATRIFCDQREQSQSSIVNSHV